MLKVAQIEDTTQNIIAPSIYIDGITIENGYRTINYSLVDNRNDWMTNQQILNELKVYITDGFTTEERLLKSVFSSNVIKNNTVRDYVKFQNTGSDVSVSAWVGNDYITGPEVVESIYSSGSIVKPVIEGSSYNYINKIKNLDLLSFDITFGTASATPTSPMPDTKLYVSYRADKKANLSFIFDIEKFLENNSREYNILKKNPIYKQKILANSYIDENKSFFSKTNITKKEKESRKINNILEANLISTTKARYYVSIADDNVSLTDKSYYDVEVKLEITDFSTKFLHNNIIKKLNEHINFIKEYKMKFEDSARDVHIKDVNFYIFENSYENLVTNNTIKNFVDTLSPICALFSGNNDEEYASLFVSLLHPLTTNSVLLEKLLTFLNKLNSSLSPLVVLSANADNVGSTLKNSNSIYEKRFTISGDNPYSADFNYDYDALHGYEVIKNDTLANLLSTTIRQTNDITQPEFLARQILEAKKYYVDPSVKARTNVEYFTISSMFFDKEEYGLLIGLPTNTTKIFDDVYTKAQEYTKFNFSFKKPETYAYQLLYSGINIKTLSNRDNNSTNNLIKNTLYDSNRDTSQNSLQFMSDTNIKNLYLILDNTTFVGLDDTSGSIQYRTEEFKQAGLTPVFQFKEENLLNPDLKPKTFLYYNTIYKNVFVDGGDLIDIYTLSEKAVSPVFTNKLRLMNGTYIVRKNLKSPNDPNFTSYDINKDLILNIPQSYLNRSTIDPMVDTTLIDL